MIFSKATQKSNEEEKKERDQGWDTTLMANIDSERQVLLRALSLSVVVNFVVHEELR